MAKSLKKGTGSEGALQQSTRYDGSTSRNSIAKVQLILDLQLFAVRGEENTIHFPLNYYTYGNFENRNDFLRLNKQIY